MFIGIECIEGNGNSEPNKELAVEFVERMKQKGFLISNAGQFRNVLKIRPPLCINKDDISTFLKSFKSILEETGLKANP